MSRLGGGTRLPFAALVPHKFVILAETPIADHSESEAEELVLGTDPLQAGARAVDEANHQDPVMTRHMPRGKPRSVVKTCTAGRGRAPDSRERP